MSRLLLIKTSIIAGMKIDDKISIIIPCNARPCLREAIDSILANTTRRPWELIVVGEWPPGDSPPADPRIRFLPTKGLGTGAMRNAAARAATGSFLLFTDSDCVADLDWIDAAAASVSATRPVAGGGIRFPEHNAWDLGDNLAIFSRMHVTRPAGPAGPLLGTNNLAIRRDVFEAVGGFRDDLTVGEDWEFLQRVQAAGYPLFFDPRFAVRHNSGRNSAAKVRQHAEWYGRGYVDLMARGVAPKSAWRADRLISALPGGIAIWSALKATTRTAALYLGHPPFWRYLRALPAAWYFAFCRRRAISKTLAARSR